jgi:hypothetical protein
LFYTLLAAKVVIAVELDNAPSTYTSRPANMFSPDATINSAYSGSVRNPRRRRRDDSDRPRELPRKRSRIGDDTFQPLEPPQTNGDGQVNGHIDADQQSSLFPGDMTIPVRDKRQTSFQRRSTKVDESNILVSQLAPCFLSVVFTDLVQTRTANYVVKRLPGLPENLRDASSGRLPASKLSCAFTELD